MEYFLSTILPIAIAAFIAGIGFLLKSFFSKIEADINKLDGRLAQLSSEIRENTIEYAKVRSEITAMWRFIDNSNKRATDKRECV